MRVVAARAGDVGGREQVEGLLAPLGGCDLRVGAGPLDQLRRVDGEAASGGDARGHAQGRAGLRRAGVRADGTGRRRRERGRGRSDSNDPKAQFVDVAVGLGPHGQDGRTVMNPPRALVSALYNDIS